MALFRRRPPSKEPVASEPRFRAPGDSDPTVHRMFNTRHAMLTVVHGNGDVHVLASNVGRVSPGIRGRPLSEGVLGVSHPKLESAAAFFSGPSGSVFVLTCFPGPGGGLDWDTATALVQPLSRLGDEGWESGSSMNGQVPPAAASILQGASLVPLADLGLG